MLILSVHFIDILKTVAKVLYKRLVGKSVTMFTLAAGAGTQFHRDPQTVHFAYCEKEKTICWLSSNACCLNLEKNRDCSNVEPRPLAAWSLRPQIQITDNKV